MIPNEVASETLIERFLVLERQTSTNVNVLAVASASDSGLDEKATDVLDFVNSLPPAYQFKPDIVRKYRQNPYEHDVVNDVTKQDLTITLETHDLIARVYRPINTQNEILPALIYFHGGGFVLGDIESCDKMLAQLCSQSSVVIISVAYRLAPETVFPGAVKDVLQATDWVVKNTEYLKVNPSRIGIGGESAGANLATVYCLLSREKNDFRPYFQLLIYPCIIGNDTSESRELFSENLLLTKKLIQWFHQHYISKEQESDPRFNVMKFDSFEHLPPAFILTCGFDPLRDEGQLYVNKLEESGIVVRHSCYTDMFHGFINFGVLQQARDAVSECAVILNGVMYLK